MAVLNTTSPVVMPGAPTEMPWKTVPSSSARTAVSVGSLGSVVCRFRHAHADGEMGFQAEPANKISPRAEGRESRGMALRDAAMMPRSCQVPGRPASSTGPADDRRASAPPAPRRGRSQSGRSRGASARCARPGRRMSRCGRRRCRRRGTPKSRLRPARRACARALPRVFGDLVQLHAAAGGRGAPSASAVPDGASFLWR